MQSLCRAADGSFDGTACRQCALQQCAARNRGGHARKKAPVWGRDDFCFSAYHNKGSCLEIRFIFPLRSSRRAWRTGPPTLKLRSQVPHSLRKQRVWGKSVQFFPPWSTPRMGPPTTKSLYVPHTSGFCATCFPPPFLSPYARRGELRRTGSPTLKLWWAGPPYHSYRWVSPPWPWRRRGTRKYPISRHRACRYQRRRALNHGPWSWRRARLPGA